MNQDSPETEVKQLERYCNARNKVQQPRWKKSDAGLSNYAGVVFTTLGVFNSLLLSIPGINSLIYLRYQLHRWHVFLAYQILNISTALAGCHGK